jgi:hypothetical protein
MYGSSTHPRKVVRSSASCLTEEVSLYMAGDIEHAKQVIRRFCKDKPSCVTVTPTAYIYTGGEEAGFVVAFRNYPRFPSERGSLEAKARELAEMLREALGQKSYMIVAESGTTWSTDQND